MSAARLSAARMLFSQAQAFDQEEAQGTAALPYYFESEQLRGGRRILRDEATRLATTAPKRGSRRRGKPGLRIGAGTVELVQAVGVLFARVDQLSARLDATYEAIDRDEVELEQLLEAIEAAAHDTMDWTSDEQGEGEDDDSLNLDDADMDFAESASRRRKRAKASAGGDTTQRNPMRASTSQAVAVGLGLNSTDWPLSAEETAEAMRKIRVCGHPESS